MADVFCVHCGKRIVLANFALGPSWTHVDSTLEGYSACRITTATPPAGTTDTEGSN